MKEKTVMNNYTTFSENVNSLIKIIDENYEENPLLRDFLSKPVCNNSHPQERCSHGMPAELALYPKEKEQKDKKRIKLIQRCSKEAKAIAEGEIDDENIRNILKAIQSQNIFLRYVDAQCKVRYFEGFAKGTERYNKVYSSKIQDAIKEMVDKGYETFALTLTCDRTKYFYNRLVAWSKSTEEINKVLENLRKNRGCEYTWVKESFKNGFPHAHIVLGFPKGTIKGYGKLRNRQKLYFGWLYKYVRSKVTSRIFRLECIKGENVKHYLTKYISKFDDFDIYKLSEKKGSFTKEERKALLCLIFTKLTNTRQFGISNNLKKKELPVEINYEETVKNFYVALSDTRNRECNTEVERKEKYARLRALLIKLCNNPLFICGKNVSFIPKDVFHKQENCSIKDFNKKSDLEREKTDSLFVPLGCGGCLYSHFRDFVLNGYDIIFSGFKKGENGEKIEIFTEEIMNNDELYIKTLVARFEELLLKSIGGMGCLKSAVINKDEEKLLQHVEDRYFEKHTDEHKDKSWFRKEKNRVDLYNELTNSHREYIEYEEWEEIVKAYIGSEE